MMTKISDMRMDISDIRRMANGGDEPACVSLIKANLAELTAQQLCMVAPLSLAASEFVLSLREVGADWDSVPEPQYGVDFSACKEPSDAMYAAFAQLVGGSCTRIVDAIDEVDA